MGRDWQPIETAPKDGTEVLIFVSSFMHPAFIVSAFWDDGLWWDIHDHGYNPDYVNHWMPLPPAPDRGVE